MSARFLSRCMYVCAIGYIILSTPTIRILCMEKGQTFQIANLYLYKPKQTVNLNLQMVCGKLPSCAAFSFELEIADT